MLKTSHGGLHRGRISEEFFEKCVLCSYFPLCPTKKKESDEGFNLLTPDQGDEI